MQRQQAAVLGILYIPRCIETAIAVVVVVVVVLKVMAEVLEGGHALDSSTVKMMMMITIIICPYRPPRCCCQEIKSLSVVFTCKVFHQCKSCTVHSIQLIMCTSRSCRRSGSHSTYGHRALHISIKDQQYVNPTILVIILMIPLALASILQCSAVVNSRE